MLTDDKIIEIYCIAGDFGSPVKPRVLKNKYVH